ncbi:hypothetical protein A2U01_0087232 [Trifolium medium]|uniref:Uncharacterized protein n=1 Tax=Trifolium medium TaxID=97028 RepID=A0A392TZX0_9FABA|nr:hypothetical protein [Trifolium medium]
MAHCTGYGVIAGFTSGSCASRSLVWRGAQLNQLVEGNPLEVARRAGWSGAARQYKIQAENV